MFLKAYFLSKSFGDCLPEEGVPVKYGACKLTGSSAFMTVLSLATSAALFGCTHGNVRCKLAFRNVPWKLPFETRLPGADKVVQIPRIVELWREAKELEDRRLLCGRDGNVNEMTMLARVISGDSGNSNRPNTSGSSATESVPCVLQVRGCCALMRCSFHSSGLTASIASEVSLSNFQCHILPYTDILPFCVQESTAAATAVAQAN
jgi:hypothetical protein